jgi:hypothetical protein
MRFKIGCLSYPSIATCRENAELVLADDLEVLNNVASMGKIILLEGPSGLLLFSMSRKKQCKLWFWEICLRFKY